MRILITNDDGYYAPGLQSALRIAKRLNGGTAEIWVVAPESEVSGVGHCISYTSPVRCEKKAERHFAVSGTPADCVLVGVTQLMADTPPDLVVSGVNKGNNAAENSLYSGTLGGAMEAALQGLNAVALSQFMGPDTVGLDNIFEASEAHGASVIERLLEGGVWQDKPYTTFYNINFPPCPAAAVKGTKITAQGFRPECRFRAHLEDAPNRRRYYWLAGSAQQVPSAPGTDAHANLQGYIAVNPVRADLTDHALVDQLSDLFAG